ncbi:MAG: type I methionyl aminopeptidase [Candidatus Sungbacteria bacterium]|nr:type I methionyl aminopeptidase [Candidatus Sungbacteria bacterium]
MITIKTTEEIAILREGGRRLAEILQKLVEASCPGVSDFELDVLAEELILACGGKPAFKGYRIKETRVAFPASICVSINDEVVHGIPRKNRILKDGDIVGIDIGMQWPNQELRTKNLELRNIRGMYTDMAVTIGVGKISAEAERLIQTTRSALDVGIRTVRPGAHVGDIGCAVEEVLKREKLGIIRDLAGHGVGHDLHEEPLIPNYGMRGAGVELKEGMVIAIEPMATLGGWRIKLDRDEWTIRTADRSLAAHFEHTLVVTKSGAEILTK